MKSKNMYSFKAFVSESNFQRRRTHVWGERKTNAIMGGVYYLSKLTNSHVHVHQTIELLRYKLGAF